MRALLFALALLASASGALPQETVAPAVRDVTAPGITPGPSGNGPLVREAVPAPPPEPPRWRRYFLPATVDAGTFVIDGRLTIRVSGVAPPAVDHTCTFAGGEAWPCGRTALHALRMFLRGRAIECLFPYADALAEVTAPCRVGATDLGAWLLSSGWAEPDELATDAYRAAALAARCAKLGLWRGAERPRGCPEPDTPAPDMELGEAPASPWLPD